MRRCLEEVNRERYLNQLGIKPASVVTAGLVHGSSVTHVSNNEAGTIVVDVDGLVTKTKGLFLSATAADCFLLYAYDPKQNVVGIGHIGWRGLLSGIVKNTLLCFIENFGSSPQDILVGIGPGIRDCHFEISPGDKDRYFAYRNLITNREGKIFVDLAGIIKIQLQEWGVKNSHIEDSGVCTYCDESKYFSYRRDKSKDIKVMIGLIGLQ